MSTATKLVSADEFRRMNDGLHRELVRGRLVEMNVPNQRHGQVCANIVVALGSFLRANGLGHLTCNDGGVITERDPDTVRGPDVAFTSYERVPRGPLPSGYLDVAPDVVFEVKPPTDRWSELLAKGAEYLEAGTALVVVCDPETSTVRLLFPNERFTVLNRDETLVLSDQLPGFEVAVGEIFR